MATTILRLPAVLAICGLAKSTTYDLIAKGDFPGPVRLSARSVGWTSDSIETWIAARIAASREAV